MKQEILEYAGHALGIWRSRRLLLESEHWDSERRRRWTQERLGRTLEHAVRHVPYYRRVLGPHRDAFPEMVEALDLSPLPFLTKRDVQDHFDELVAENVSADRARRVATSGSTGTPATFLVDGSSSTFHFATTWRALNWTGYRFGDRFAEIRAAEIDDPLVRYDPTMNRQVISVFKMRREAVPEILDGLKRFSPSLVKGYPSALYFLSQWIEELGLEPYRPRRILTCAEMCFPEHREKIEAVFDAPVFDYYGLNERAALISTCEEGSYHVHEEYSFVEFLPDREICSRNLTEIVTTTFHNGAMPLIRYRTGDHVPDDIDTDCACGRSLRSVTEIRGRFQDAIVTPDGCVHTTFELAVSKAHGVLMSQLRQDDVDSVEVRIVPDEAFDESEERALVGRLRQILGREIDIRCVLVDTIPPERNGKVPFIVSRPGRHIAMRKMEEAPR